MFSSDFEKFKILILIFLLSSFIISCGGDNNNKNSDSKIETDVNLTVTYDYDELNRIKTANYSNGQIVNYVYDSSGNILEKRVLK